jgi:hypothetical protein
LSRQDRGPFPPRGATQTIDPGNFKVSRILKNFFKPLRTDIGPFTLSKLHLKVDCLAVMILVEGGR